MNAIVSNIKYKLSYQFNWSVLSVAIYAVTIFLTFYALIKTSVINEDAGSLVYRLWALIFTHFAFSMRFKEDFDFMLILSKTRESIFLSLLTVAVGFSVILSGLIVLERVIVDYLNNVLGFYNTTDPFHFVAPYGTDNIFLQFVFFFALCSCFSVFGLLMGSLFYRFGKKFTLAFWLLFSAIPSVVFPMILWVSHLRGNLTETITAMIEFFRYFDLLSGSGYLFILTIVFSITAYLNIRRLPQQ
ncbi:hypothetical protein ACFL6O_02415 [candidate division KSB1 bacterium]